MNDDQFWHVISTACRPELSPEDDWAEELQAVLVNYDPAEIVEWNHIFDRLAARAYTIDLWGAAYTRSEHSQITHRIPGPDLVAFDFDPQ